MTLSDLRQPDQFAAARRRLAQIEPRFAPVVEAHLPPDWPGREAGFSGLTRAIAFQQISVAAGRTIWGRVETLVGDLTPERMLAHDVETLKGCGLSRSKATYIRAIAQAVADGSLDFDRIESASDADAKAELVAVKGVGPWTADIYLMFALGRPDAFAAGDLGLQEGFRRLFAADERPNEKALLALSEAWRPVRAVAAMALWGYLNAEQDRQRGGV